MKKIPHAFLFFGEAQLGKKTLALEFIKLLSCESDDFLKKPCDTCLTCQKIQKRQHPDLIIIEPLKKEIQILQIRDLIWKLSLKPHSAPIKTAIIDQAHLMNQEAQSAFLKTLEEPKGKTLLILITEYPEILLPTILSRVERLKFYPLNFSEIENYLKTYGISENKAKELASLSLGRPGRAINFLLNPQSLENQKKKIKELIKILNSDLAFRFQYARDLTKEPQKLKEILDIWLSYFRDNLLTNLNSQQRLSTLKKLKNILRLIQNTNFLISTTNVNPRLALEILMLEL